MRYWYILIKLCNINFAGEFVLQGVDVCGEATIVLTNSAQLFEWKEFGLTLSILEGTLPEGVNHCIVSIKASIAGEYQFPPDFHLASAVFWLYCQPVSKFMKPIKLEMDHCAKNIVGASSFSFMRAVCSQVELPYAFKPIGGSFVSEYYGTIALNSFSGIGIGHRSGNHLYSARIYNIHQLITNYKIDFVVVWNTRAHLNVSI